MTTDRNSNAANDREYVQPTDDQLAFFMAVQTFGPGFTPLEVDAAKNMLAIRLVKVEWLYRHRQFQEAAWNL